MLIRPAVALVVGAVLLLAGCATSPTANTTDSAVTDSAFPVTITHALGKTTIPAKPKRVAAIAWGNQDTALALGVLPVGVDSQVWVWSGTAKPGVYDWTTEKLEELGEKTPVLYDVTDGIDFEGIADTKPDLILAAQSGLTSEQYATLGEIAPVVAYPEIPWFTPWREQIKLNAQALGLKNAGEQLVADVDTQIAKAKSGAADIDGKTAAFFNISQVNLASVSLYTEGDARTAFLEDLGFSLPKVAADAAKEGSFFLDFSAENADKLAEVDVIVTYGNDNLLPVLQAHPLWGTLPAVKNGAVVVVGEGDAYSAAVSPTALSIPWVLDRYVGDLQEAAAKVQ